MLCCWRYHSNSLLKDFLIHQVSCSKNGSEPKIYLEHQCCFRIYADAQCKRALNELRYKRVPVYEKFHKVLIDVHWFRWPHNEDSTTAWIWCISVTDSQQCYLRYLNRTCFSFPGLKIVHLTSLDISLPSDVRILIKSDLAAAPQRDAVPSGDAIYSCRAACDKTVYFELTL